MVAFLLSDGNEREQSAAGFDSGDRSGGGGADDLRACVCGGQGDRRS